MELSEFQANVAESTEPRLLVRAAAGSGKTRALVARYVRLVTEHGLEPDEVLAITFTRKAAAEMKLRIVRALDASGRPDAARAAETGPVQTIHGFCERVLRENALLAGLDPDFTIVEPSMSAQWIDEAIDEAVRLAQTDGDEAIAFEELAGSRHRAQGDGRRRLHADIREAMNLLRGCGLAPDQVEANHADAGGYVDLTHQAMVDGLTPEARQIFEASQGEFHGRFFDACKRTKAAPDWLPSGPGMARAAEGEALCAAVSCGLARLACRAWRSIESRMLALQSFDFTLLEALAVDLVEQHSGAAERLRRRYKALLIDESQDLNPVQFRLIRALSLRIETMVGDGQQSIFGFRQADVRLFERHAESTPTLTLPRNYRSDAGILRFVDGLFASIWPGRYEPMAPKDGADDSVSGVEWWDFGTLDAGVAARLIQGLVREEGAAQVAILVRTGAKADAIRNRLLEIGVPSRIVGGGAEYFSRLELRDFANAMDALLDPTNDFALAAVLHSPFARISLDSIVLLAREKGIYESLRAGSGGMEKDTARFERFLGWFTPLAESADRLAAWELVGKLLFDTPYLAHVAPMPNGRQAIANTRKLLSLAISRPDMGPREFTAWIREIQELKHREGDAPSVDDAAEAVTILTIHKAKGLEFPVVVLAETDGAMDFAARSVEVDRDIGLVACKPPSLASDARPLARDWIASGRKNAEREESLRLLYVALTRAQRRLAIIGSKKPRSLGSFVADRLAISTSKQQGLRVVLPPSSDPV